MNLAYILTAFQLLQWKSAGDQMIKGSCTKLHGQCGHEGQYQNWWS